MDEQDIAKLRAAGYSEEDIRDFVASRAGAEPRPQAPGAATESALPEVDVTKPSESLERARAAGVPTEAEGPGLAEYGTAAGTILGENAGKIALGAGGVAGAYAANQIRKGMMARAEATAAQAAAQQAQAQAALEQARAAQMQAQGVQERFAQRQAAQAARATPTAPQILDAQGRPMVRPVAPTAVAPGPVAPGPVVPGAATGPLPPTLTAGEPMFRPPAQPSVINRATDIVKRLALEKVAPALGAVARVAGPVGVASMLLEPGNSGQNYPFPQSGPLRGSELNPATGRPWTPEELAQYRAQYGR